MSWRVVPVLLAGALTACGSHGSEGGAELTVSAASSLSEAFPAYAEQVLGEPVRFSFAGSDTLAAQIRQGATPDVYAAADTELPQRLNQEGLVGEPVEFAANQLVLAVPAGSNAIASLDDLGKPGVRLAVGDPEVPVGSYTREVLERLPDEEAEAILANVASEEPDVAGIVGKLSQGAVDAGFVYASDVAAAADRLVAIELPRRLRPDVTYAIAIVSDAELRSQARSFVDGLLEPEGGRVLRDAGFLPAP